MIFLSLVNVEENIEYKIRFQKITFCELIMFFILLKEKVIIYINSECIMSLINKKLLKGILLNIENKKIKMSINIRKINTLKYMINDYYLFNLYISNTSIN